jgi:4,5-dihydroxyphthalate decarboxylase
VSRLKLTLACGDYDRTRALHEGTVSVEGTDLNVLFVDAAEIFWRMLQYEEFDISEMSLSNYLTEISGKKPRFIAIPVFPSRSFRHGFIFINKKSGIKSPQDLRGKKMGIPEFSMTALLFMRGFLQDDYGIAPSDIEWYEGGKDEIKRKGRIKTELPDSIRVYDTSMDRSLSEMLADGEIDALMQARIPRCFWEGHPDVERLFPNYKELEMDYYRRTKVFPIMHTIVIKREIYEDNPWLAQNLYRAFLESKRISQEANKYATGALNYTLPWLIAERESTVAVMGEDFWPYGVEANRPTLEAATRYSFEQGLAKKQFSIEELFAPNTLNT